MPYQMAQILKRKKVRKKVRRVEKLPLRGRHREQLGSAIARGEAARHEIRQPEKGVLHYQKGKKKNQLKGGKGREKKGKEKEEEEEKLRQRNWDRQGKESRGGTERQQR